MEVSVKMAPKTSKSQVGADFCYGWGNCHICIYAIFKFLEIDIELIQDCSSHSNSLISDFQQNWTSVCSEGNQKLSESQI